MIIAVMQTNICLMTTPTAGCLFCGMVKKYRLNTKNFIVKMLLKDLREVFN